MKPLSSHQAMIYAIIRKAAEDGERCPMNRDIAKQLGIVSTAAVSDTIRLIAEKGWIAIVRGSNSRVVDIVGTTLSTAGVTRGRRAVRTRKQPLPPRVYREPCPRCGTRADVGCCHLIGEGAFA